MLRITTERMHGLAKTPVSLRVRRRQGVSAAAVRAAAESSEESGDDSAGDHASLSSEFVEACKRAAAVCGVREESVIYSGVLALFDRLLTREGMELIPKGDLALALGIYAPLCHRALEAGGEDMTPAEAAALLESELPLEGDVEIALGDVRVSRTTARCAIPFSLGVCEMISEQDVEFLARALSSGNVKAARYALNFILREEADHEADHEADSQGADQARVAIAPYITEGQVLEVFSRLPDRHVSSLATWLRKKASHPAAREEFIGRITQGLAALPYCSEV